MATPVAPAKINVYKFVGSPKISGDVLTKSGALGQVINKTEDAKLTALNNIGNTLNSIQGSLKGILDIQTKQLKDDQKDRVKDSFTAKYTIGKGLKASRFTNPFKGIKPGSWWKGLLGILGGLLKFLIIRPILEWLADPQNQEKIKATLETFKDIFVWLFNFTKGRIAGIVDGLYNFFNEENSWQDRLGGLLGGLGNLGVLLLGLRWLSNPLRVITDLRSVLTFFYNRLTGAKKRLTGAAPGAVRRGPAGRVRGAIKGTAAITALAVGGSFALGKWLEWQEQQNEKGDEVDANQQNTIDGLSSSVQQLVDEFEKGYLDAVDPAGAEERSKGGSVKRKRRKSSGGYISGPQSGYPVSLDGKGIDFIGHGTEYVAQKPGGDAYVVPLDTPHTRRDPELTDKRIAQAMSKGYGLSEGGPVLKKPQGGWITGPMSGYPVSVNGGKADFIGHGTEYISKQPGSSDFGVIPFHKGVSREYTKKIAQLTALGGGPVPTKKPSKSDLLSGRGSVSPRTRKPKAFLGKLFSGATKAIGNFFGGGSKSSGGGGGGGFLSGIGNFVSGIFGGGNRSSASSSGGSSGGGFLSGFGNFVSGIFGGKKNESPYTFGPLASGDTYGAALAGNKIFGFDYNERGNLKGSTFLPGILSQGTGIGRTIGKIFGNESLGGSIGGLLRQFGGIMGKQEGFDLGTLLQSGLGVAGHFFKDKKGLLGQIGKYASIFTGPNADKFTFGEKLVLAAKMALEGTAGAEYIEPIADMLGINIDNASAMASQAGIGTGGYSSPYDIPPNPAFETGNNPGVQGGGIQAAVSLGKWALSRGMTVMGHPNFRNNKWTEFGANTGVGYSSAGKEYIGNPPRGSQRSMGLSIDVKDYRDENPIGRLASLAAEAYANRTGNKISTIAYDGWGMWEAGSKKMNPGNYGYPDSVYFGVAQEAQEQGGTGIEAGGATESAAVNRMIDGGVKGMSPQEQLLAARAQINQSQAGQDTNWLTSALDLFAPPKAKEEEKPFYSDLLYRASDTNSFAKMFADSGVDNDGINKALNVTGFGVGKNSLNLGTKYTFNTDDNYSFNNIYKPSEQKQKAQFRVDGGDTDTNDNKTIVKGGFTGSLDRTEPFSITPLDIGQNFLPQNTGFASGRSERKKEEEPVFRSNVSSSAPGESVRRHFEQRRGDHATEAAKERNAARTEMQMRNAKTMNALITQVSANNAQVSANVAKAHATISNLINNAARGGNAQQTAGKIMQGTASTLAQPAFKNG